jgi:lipopolysaccharide biosynthesis glycosyltransferase
MYDPAIAHIVYASDDGFAEILGVSLVSLFENSGDMKEIRVYILDSGISEHNRERIEEVCTRYQRSLPVWLKARNITEELGMRVAADRGSLSQFARLFVASDLPADLERTLYLDCDIIFCQSVGLLWNLDMHGKTIAALNDAFSRQYRANIDLEPEDVMFNSGVMLIDLNRWKQQSVEEHLLKFIAMKQGRIQQGDQGALNAVLSHDVYCFNPRFNSVTIFYDFTYHELYVYRKPAGKYYTEAEIKEATEHPVIIHFTTSFLSRRPWVKDCHHRYCELWRSYKAESPWRDEPLREDTRPAWKLRGIRIFKKLPRGLAMHIAGFLQAYGRPIKNKW